jgi:ATP:ADP antiporter, AAA family
MKAPRFLLRTLNVRADEWWLVQRLFFLQFFQGASIAFFFTAAFSYFLTRFPITELPYVIILSSFLLWMTGFLYNKLEHRLVYSRLSILIALIILGSILAFGIGTLFIQANWFFYLMLSWFNVLYLLNNLEFWGFASQLYDVRQSKRLFGVISAGDIPAKFIGYFVAGVIVNFIGNDALRETQYLLAAAFLSMIISLPYWISISRKGVFSRISDQYTNKSKSHASHVKGILKEYTGNTLVRRIAVISFLAYVCFILTNFGFYSEVQLHKKSDQSLAAFIASFYVVARLAALCMKTIFTSRLLRSLGYKTSMLIVPLSLIIFSGFLYLAPTMANSDRFTFYVFGAAAMTIEALRTSLISPVLLTLMQPLPTTERLRAHNIVKGIMDPFAYLFSGLLLLLLFRTQQFNLATINHVLVVLSIVWIVGIIFVHKQYLKTLIRTVSSRYFSQEEFNMYDKATREMVAEKIENGNELEVLYVLNMLDSNAEEKNKELVIKALHHPSSKVISEAIRIVDSHQISEANIKLRQLIQNHPDPLIRSDAIKVFGKFDFDESIVATCLRHAEPLIEKAAIVAVLNHRDNSLKEEAKNKLYDLLHSVQPEQRIEGIQLVAALVIERGFDDNIKTLLQDPDKRVVDAAIRATGEKLNYPLLPEIFGKWNEHEKTVVEALVKGGNLSLPIIRKELIEKPVSSKKAERLIFVCGRIGTEAAQQELIGFLNHIPHRSASIIKALYRCRYTPQPSDQKFLESVTREYIVSAAEILHMQKRLNPNHGKYSLLLNSLEIELSETREVLLCLFSFLYDREKITKVKNTLLLRKKELQANAFELVDMTVRKDFAHPFNTVFEQGSIEDRCEELRNIFPKDGFPEIESVLTRILGEDKFNYNHWTRACSLYTSKKYIHRIHESLIRKYLQSDNYLLKQTAEYAV